MDNLPMLIENDGSPLVRYYVTGPDGEVSFQPFGSRLWFRHPEDPDLHDSGNAQVSAAAAAVLSLAGEDGLRAVLNRWYSDLPAMWKDMASFASR